MTTNDPSTSGAYADPGGHPIPPDDIEHPGTTGAPDHDPQVGTTGNPPQSPDRSIDEGHIAQSPDPIGAGGELVGEDNPDDAGTVTIDTGNIDSSFLGGTAPVSADDDPAQPSRELPETTIDDFDPADPRTQVPTGTTEVPDNPSSAVEPNTVDKSIDQPHNWSARSSSVDTGWVTAPGLQTAWIDAQRDGHGTAPGDDNLILIPAHLRGVEDAALALVQALAANVGDSALDEYRLSLDIDEADGTVGITVNVGRRPGTPTGGDVTGATTAPSAVLA